MIRVKQKYYWPFKDDTFIVALFVKYFAMFQLQVFSFKLDIPSTLVISKPKELSKMLLDIRTSTYQICSIEEKKNKSNNHI